MLEQLCQLMYYIAVLASVPAPSERMQMQEVVVTRRRITPQQKAKQLEIIKETSKLLGKYGSDISMEMVGDAAQVSRSTLYRYYVSREHLISAVTIEAGNSLVEYLASHPPQGRTVGARTTSLCAQIANLAEGSPNLLAACVNNLASDDPAAIDSYAEIEKLITKIFRTVSTNQDFQLSLEVQTTIFRYLLGSFLLATTGKLTFTELATDLARLCESLMTSVWDVDCE